MAPPHGLTRSSSSAMPKWSRKASTWTAKASLSSNGPMSSIVRPVRDSAPLGCGDGAHAHDLGLDADEAVADQPHAYGESELLRDVLGGQQAAGGAVVEARGVAGGDVAVRAERGLQ